MSEIDIAGPTLYMSWAEAEAMIESEMEKFRSCLVEKVKDPSEKYLVEELLESMRLMVSLMREKKSEDGSFRVSCLISEIVEKAGIIHHLIEIDDYHHDEKTSLGWMINKTIKRLRESGQGSPEDGTAGDAVGLEEDVERFLHEMNDHEQRVFIACIFGVGGSGKTTLARELYTNADVVNEFELRVWVSCGEFLSEKELLINILQQVADLDAHVGLGMELDHLQQMLIQQLQGKQSFIVLNDIHGLYSFDYVYHSLHNIAEGRSILLLTCRTWHFPIDFHYYHQMKPLDLDKSWQLLLQTMLSSNDQIPKRVERRGKTMLMKHTGGMPLAVKEVAMEWLEKRRLGIEWEDVVESRDLKLKATLDAIESSAYRYLNRDSQLIFIHLGLFKEGITIRARKLQQTWNASGAQEQHSYEQCVDALSRENIIAMNEKNCHMGVVYHKLSIRKMNEGASNRVVYCSRERFNCSTDQNQRLICVFFYGGGCLDGSPSYWKSFEQLRVLDFEGFGLMFLPEAVGELIELRYLGLRNNYIQELPSSLCRLKKLEVLDIALNFMVKVPDNLWEMDALVHLYMSDIFCMKPLKIEALKNLQTLTYISVDNWEYEVSGLRMMNNLQKLGMEKMDEIESYDVGKLFASLAALESPKTLVLRGSRFRSMASLDELGVLHRVHELKLDGFITNLPRAENFPPYLYYLTLVNSCVDEDPMPTLEKLSKLKYLKLQNAYTGPQMMISKDGFRKLEHLCFEELWHLRTLQFAQGGALPRLNKFEIARCPYLHSLPQKMMARKNLELNIVATKNIATKKNK